MRIRPQQIAALDAHSEDQFRAELLQHLARYAPELHDLRGDDAFRAVVDEAFVEASRHGFTARGPVRFFAEAMVSYGIGFHRDPLMPTVAERCANLLAAPPEDAADELVQADRLFDALEAHRQSAHGAEDEHRLAALARAASSFRSLEALGAGTETEDIASILRGAHPQRAAAAGYPGLHALIAGAARIAAEHGLERWPSSAVLAGVLFVFGSEVERDPLYPFVQEGLERATGEALDPRLRGLGRRVAVYLDASLKALSN